MRKQLMIIKQNFLRDEKTKSVPFVYSFYANFFFFLSEQFLRMIILMKWIIIPESL